LGLALADTGLHDEAIVEYHAAIHSAPEFWQAHYRLADELRNRGLADEAIAEYRTTIGIKFDFLPAHGKLWGELGRKGLLDQRLAEYREALRLAPDATQSLTERLARAFLEFQDYAAAEAVLRQCLASSEATHPEAWTTFNRKSLLGGALLEQAVSLKTTNPAAAETKLGEAEPLLLAAYAGLKAREAKIASFDKIHLTEALQRLVKLYTQRDKLDEAARWQKELTARKPDLLPSAASQPQTTKPSSPN
jgi:tetratricopeptide (TPR) repeat protein